MSEDITLNQRLVRQGYAVVDARTYWSVGTKHILRDGVVVFTGDAYQVMNWIKEQQ